MNIEYSWPPPAAISSYLELSCSRLICPSDFCLFFCLGAPKPLAASAVDDADAEKTGCAMKACVDDTATATRRRDVPESFILDQKGQRDCCVQRERPQRDRPPPQQSSSSFFCAVLFMRHPWLMSTYKVGDDISATERSCSARQVPRRSGEGYRCRWQ